MLEFFAAISIMLFGGDADYVAEDDTVVRASIMLAQQTLGPCSIPIFERYEDGSVFAGAILHDDETRAGIAIRKHGRTQGFKVEGN